MTRILSDPANTVEVKWLPLILVFLSIFSPLVRSLFGQIDTQAAFFALAICISAMRVNGVVKQAGSYAVLLAILVALSSYGLMMAIANVDAAISLHATVRPLRALGTVLGCCVIAFLASFKYKDGPSRSGGLFVLILLAISAHGCIMIAEFLSPSFRDSVYQFTVNTDLVTGARLYYSMAGLSNGGGAQLSVYQSMGCLLVPSILAFSSSWAMTLLIATCGAICLASIAISGRSGLLCLCLFYPLICVMVYGFLSGIRLAILHVAIGVGTIAGIGSMVIILNSDLSSGDEKSSSDGIDAVFMRIQDEITESESAATLRDHVLVPETPTGLFFGDPRHAELSQGSVDRILNSDIGYVRTVFSYGLVGACIQYAFYVFVAILGVRGLKSHALRPYAAFVVVNSVAMLFFEMKETFALSRIGLSITALSAAWLSMQLYTDGNIKNHAPVH